MENIDYNAALDIYTHGISQPGEYKYVDTDGNIFYCKNGKRHREDGPAIVYKCGTRKWYVNGKFHNECGPAIIWDGGDEYYYLNGQEVSKQEFMEQKLLNLMA